MRMVYWSVMVKREVSMKAKHPIYQLIYIPTVVYGHGLWVVIKKKKNKIMDTPRKI